MADEKAKQRIRELKEKQKRRRKLRDKFKKGKDDPSLSADLQKELYGLIVERGVELANKAQDKVLQTMYIYGATEIARQEIDIALEQISDIFLNNRDRLAWESSEYGIIASNAYRRGKVAAISFMGRGITDADIYTTGRNLGAVLSRLFNDMENLSAGSIAVIKKELAEGIIRGDQPRRIAKLINDQLTDMARYRAERIARTEIVYAKNTGYLDTLELEEGDRALVVWLSASDDRVRDEHRRRNGIVLTIKQARQLLGEPNCRCSIAALRKDDKRRGEKLKNEDLTKYLRK